MIRPPFAVYAAESEPFPRSDLVDTGFGMRRTRSVGTAIYNSAGKLILLEDTCVYRNGIFTTNELRAECRAQYRADGSFAGSEGFVTRYTLPQPKHWLRYIILATAIGTLGAAMLSYLGISLRINQIIIVATICGLAAFVFVLVGWMCEHANDPTTSFGPG